MTYISVSAIHHSWVDDWNDLMEKMGMGIETASELIFVGLTEDRLSTGRGPVDKQGTAGTA